MQDSAQPLSRAVRDVHRQLVRELGLMSPSFAGTAYSPTACHAIWDIAHSDSSTTVAGLSDSLIIDEASVQRTLFDLLDAGELHERGGADEDDEGLTAPTTTTTSTFSLTSKGQQTVRDLDASGQEQATRALTGLPPHDQELILSGLRLYTHSLSLQRHDRDTFRPIQAVEILSGWQPGLIGRALEMHATYYASTVGFGSFFESSLATGLADLVSRFGSSSEKRNNAWSAKIGGRIVGTVFIDGDRYIGQNRAHLRAFIVDGGARGGGIGKKLLTKAVEFVDARGFEETHLWTFSGLDAARRMYESFGFVLQQESVGRQWGVEMTEQLFVRKRNASAIFVS